MKTYRTNCLKIDSLYYGSCYDINNHITIEMHIYIYASVFLLFLSNKILESSHIKGVVIKYSNKVYNNLCKEIYFYSNKLVDFEVISTK